MENFNSFPPNHTFMPPMPEYTPPRPAAKLPDLAEAIMLAIHTKSTADFYDISGVDISFGEYETEHDKAYQALRSLRAQFADIGISPAYLKLLKEVL